MKITQEIENCEHEHVMCVADDGNCEIEYDSLSGREAAEDYVSGGSWGDRNKTTWITVYTWERCRDCGADLEDTRDSHTIAIEPREPRCVDDQEHDWRSPHGVVGGIEENPGVQGHGGGVVCTEVCRYCGVYRVTDTWAQNPATGEQGLTSVKYRERDDDSYAYAVRCAIRDGAGDRLVALEAYEEIIRAQGREYDLEADMVTTALRAIGVEEMEVRS